MTSPRCALLLAALLAFAGTLRAQEPATTLENLQTRSALTDEDRAALQQWLGQRIANVVGADALVAQGANTQLREAYKGTDAFKEGYVAACLEAVSSAYQKAPPLSAARLLSLVAHFDDLRGLNLFIEALGDDRAAVRATAAIALRRLQPKLAGDAAACGTVLAALKTAGGKESSGETLRLIYAAMNYSGVTPATNLRASAQAILNVLEERAKLYTGSSVRAEGADLAVLCHNETLRGAFDEAERKRYAIVLAKLLHHGVERYATGEMPLGKVRDRSAGPDAIALRNDTELLIRETEEQLVKLLALEQAPQVTEKMLRADRTEMVIELGKWLPIFKDKLGVDLPPLNAPPPDESEEGPEESPEP
ncbi:MAG: hypothetical protein PVJ57_17175 [Phycisphaerae bacterium]|jgi:hypothetical protein